MRCIAWRFLVAYWRVSRIGKFQKELGANIRSFRKQTGLSQESLAEKADLHPVYISYSRDCLHSPGALFGIRPKCSLKYVSSLFARALKEVRPQRLVGRLQTGPLCRRGNAGCRCVAVKGISLPCVPLALALVEAN